MLNIMPPEWRVLTAKRKFSPLPLPRCAAITLIGVQCTGVVTEDAGNIIVMRNGDEVPLCKTHLRVWVSERTDVGGDPS